MVNVRGIGTRTSHDAASEPMWLRGSLVSAVVVLAAGAVSLLTASLLGYSTLRAAADLLSGDGAAEDFSEAIHAALAARLRLSSLGLFVVAGVVGWRRRDIARMLLTCRDLAHDAGQSLKSMWAEDGVTLVAVAAMTLVGAAIRLANLDQPVRGDEAWTTLSNILQSVPTIVSGYYDVNDHILYCLITHVGTSLFGPAPWVIRLPSLLIGIATIPLAYVVTRALWNRDAALFGAAFVASSGLLILYSTAARGYSFIIAFSFATLLFGSYAVRRRTAAAWLVISVLNALGLLTIPTMVVPIAVTYAWLLGSLVAVRSPVSDYRYLATSIALTATLAALFYLPAFIRVDMQQVMANARSLYPALPGESAAGYASRKLGMLWHGCCEGLPAVVPYLVIGSAAVSIFIHRRASRDPLPLGLVGAVAVVVLAVVAPTMLTPRLALFLLVVCYLAAAATWGWALRALVERLAPRAAAAVPVTAVLVATAFAANVYRTNAVRLSPEGNPLPHAEVIAGHVVGAMAPGDVVARLSSTPGGSSVAYYLLLAGIDPSIADADLATLVPDGTVSRAFLLSGTPDAAEVALETRRLAELGFSEPRLVHIFPDSLRHLDTVYLFEASR